MKRINFNHACAQTGIYNPLEFICKKYKSGMSGEEISEYLHDNYNINITGKSIIDKIKTKITLRSRTERKINAIKRGRMIYFKKPEGMKYKTKSISAKTRYEVMERDKRRCQKCGGSPETGHVLELHHINGTASTLENLMTICYLCHRGLHANNKL
jgi:hypothetical protein